MQNIYPCIGWKGEVYEPFIVSGNVTDEQFSIFLENSINGRDLSTFFFEAELQEMRKRLISETSKSKKFIIVRLFFFYV